MVVVITSSRRTVRSNSFNSFDHEIWFLAYSYNGHYHYVCLNFQLIHSPWPKYNQSQGYYLNDLLNWPTGRIELNGTATDVDYTFELIRTGGTGPITSKARVVFNEKNGRSIEVPMEIKDGAEAISEGRLIGRQLSGEGVPGL